MAVYKVIQDVESEDKLLGPLTFKGFIYMLIAGALAFINFRLLIATEMGAFRWLLILIFGLPMLLFGVLASPLGREQPTEVWLLSRIRFLLQPRRRVWNQSGIKHLVTITAPKTLERHLTKELSQSEVSSRLRALAMTMDSRGWAVKNKAVESDRLVSPPSSPTDASSTDVTPADDILDEQNNPTAKKFAELMQAQDEERRKAITHRIKTAGDGHDDRQLKHRSTHKKQAVDDARLPVGRQVTAHSQPAKLELAQSGNDLSVDSIAKLANRQPKVERIGPGEVVISLH